MNRTNFLTAVIAAWGTLRPCGLSVNMNDLLWVINKWAAGITQMPTFMSSDGHSANPMLVINSKTVGYQGIYECPPTAIHDGVYIQPGAEGTTLRDMIVNHTRNNFKLSCEYITMQGVQSINACTANADAGGDPNDPAGWNGGYALWGDGCHYLTLKDKCKFSVLSEGPQHSNQYAARIYANHVTSEGTTWDAHHPSQHTVRFPIMSDSTFTGDVFNETPGNGVWLSGGVAGGVNGGTFHNNTFTGCTFNFKWNQNCSLYPNCKDVVFEDCTFYVKTQVNQWGWLIISRPIDLWAGCANIKFLNCLVIPDQGSPHDLGPDDITGFDSSVVSFF